MAISRFLGVAAASLMIAMPVAANAQSASTSASRLSISQASVMPARAGAAMGKQSKMGGNSLWIIGAIALVGGVIWAVAEDDSNDNPVSS